MGYYVLRDETDEDAYDCLVENGSWETEYPKDYPDGYLTREQLGEMLGVPPESLPEPEEIINPNYPEHSDAPYDSLMFKKVELANAIMASDIPWAHLKSSLFTPEQQEKHMQDLRDLCRDMLKELYPYMGISYWTAWLDETTYKHLCSYLEIRLCGKRFLLLRERPYIMYQEEYL